MKRPATSPLAPSSTKKDTSLLSKALPDLSRASNLKDERVGHFLATWALSCPLARRQFNNAVQYMNTATSTQTTGEACKAAVEVYTASLLLPSPMCELVLNMRPPKSSWRTLSELYTLCKLEYHRTVPGAPYSRPMCTERDFQAQWKEMVAPVELDHFGATVLPKATGISWPFASWVKYILSRMGLVRSINCTFPLTFIVRGNAYPVAGGNRTELTISLANFAPLACSSAGLLVLSMANCDGKAMDPWDVVEHHLGGQLGGTPLTYDPNMALSVLYGLGRWEVGRSGGGGGMDPQRRGRVRVGGGRGDQRQQADKQQQEQ